MVEGAARTNSEADQRKKCPDGNSMTFISVNYLKCDQGMTEEKREALSTEVAC